MTDGEKGESRKQAMKIQVVVPLTTKAFEDMTLRELSPVVRPDTELSVEGFQVRAAHTGEDVQPGQRVSVMVRPENVVLGPHAAGLDCNKCRGTVLHQTYQGTTVRYEIELTSLQHVFADSSQTAETDLFDIGDMIDLGWEADRVVVLTG